MKCEDDRCIRSACLGLDLTIAVFAGLAALATGKPKHLFFSCSPEAHTFIEEIDKGEREMPIIASAPKSEFEPAPEGLHVAVCVDVVDLGMVTENYEGRTATKHKIRVIWELEEVDERGRRFRIFQTYTLSLHEKAKLRQHLEAWRGRKFTAAELEGFDVEKLIGVSCQLQVVHNIKDSGTFANLQAIVPLGKGMTKLRPSEDYVRVKDREPKPETINGETDKPVYDDDVPF